MSEARDIREAVREMLRSTVALAELVGVKCSMTIAPEAESDAEFGRRIREALRTRGGGPSAISVYPDETIL